ncbi:MAG: hypothetical protein OHK0039_30360 [Bacteroidia bacterium]
MTSSFEISPHIAQHYDAQTIRLEIALALFQAGIFNLGQGSEFAQMTQRAFQQELSKRHIPMHYDKEILEHDIKTLDDLFDDRRQ